MPAQELHNLKETDDLDSKGKTAETLSGKAETEATVMLESATEDAEKLRKKERTKP